VSEIQREYAPKGVQFLEVAFDEMTQYLPGFMQQYQPPFPVGHASRDVITAFMQHSVMMPFMVPQMMIVDRQGTIRAQYPAGDPIFQNVPQSIKAALDQFLKPEAAPKKTAAAHKPAHSAGKPKAN
jgi:hypothetical protein